VLALNPGATRNPASVMKLFTTYAALELLGPAFRWKTEAYQDGPDLVLKGYGDPKLNYESFWMLLRNLRARGLRELRGDIVLDRSYFAAIHHEPIDSEVFRPYNVLPDALLVNFKSLRFVFWPDDGKVRLFVEPQLPGLEVVNSLKLSDGACPEGRAFRDLTQASFQSKPPRAAFTGLYPLTCGERELNVALHQPEDYVAAMIRFLWAEMGGSWSGRLREGTVSPTAKLLYAHESDPLAGIVRDINKFSNNPMAPALSHARRRARRSARAARCRGARDRAVADAKGHRGAGARAGERLGAFAQRACERRDAHGASASGVEEHRDARVHGLATGRSGRRHHAKAAAVRGHLGQCPHQDGVTFRRAFDGRLRP